MTEPTEPTQLSDRADRAGPADASPSPGTFEIDCPQCGGENPLAAGERFLSCVFCDTTLFLDRAQVVGHFVLPRLLDREKATAALRRWMTGNETVKNLDRKSKIEKLVPVTFPMWLFRTQRGSHEKVVVEPAAPTPIPTLADLDVPGGELEPYRRADDGVEEIPVAIPLETARGWLDQRHGGERSAGGDAVKVLESSLVEVPLWKASYRYDGKSFHALVEGSTGQVLASVYPEKAESPYVLVAVLGLVLFGLEGLIITNPIVKLFAYGITAVPLALLAYWVTRKV